MRVFQTFLFSVLLLVSVVSAADEAAVRERLAGMLPAGTEVDIVSSPVAGLVEVRVGTEVVFMTTDGKHLIRGEVLDLEAGEDLVELGRRDLRRLLIEAFDDDSLISYGDASLPHEVLVFTDTDCGFCRRMHQQIDEYLAEGIRVRYAGYPRAGIGSSTHQDLVSIWCAADQHAAMDLAQLGSKPEVAHCPAPIEAHFELGRALGIRGTPTLVLANGESINGIETPGPLRQRLERIAQVNGSAD